MRKNRPTPTEERPHPPPTHSGPPDPPGTGGNTNAQHRPHPIEVGAPRATPPKNTHHLSGKGVGRDPQHSGSGSRSGIEHTTVTAKREPRSDRIGHGHLVGHPKASQKVGD